MKFVFYSLFLLTTIISCSPNNVTIDNDLKKHFDDNKVEGCFAIMNNGTGQFTIYNRARYFDSSYLPASTFKIVNSLIGLQTGIISSDSMVIKWDSIQRRKEWDRDLTMFDAFRVSAVNYYQEVARRIGKDTMETWLNVLGYGAKTKKDTIRIKTSVDSFWLDNSLKITPDQQLGLVKSLYFDELPGFFKTTQEKVKNAMLFENNTKYRLGYKTGWGFTDAGHSIGWIVGWIEENRHPYFFVLNIESPDRDFDMWNVRMKILKDILKEKGFLEGKM